MDVPSPEGRTLDERYRFEVFSESSAGESEVADLLVGAGVLPPDRAGERAENTVLVGLERDEGLVAIATATLYDHSHLRMRLWAYTTFVAREHRGSDIAFLLLHATRDHLCERYASGADTRAAGMLMEVQSELLKHAENEAIWQTSRFAFVGEDEIGAHHRVYYFPGALAPPPPRAGS